ncbi:hypothetical protein [Blastococcus mobilis]|uniref:Uncharacterized protein n=1 Tax=Blastococcus mobilis TaxID=1938746 RepID=A0A238VH67_9ACTN|nr:hypothetical protein [Blastococcus mobilis]SNR33033.1 hypothetical protein SAMN06272737_10382 [Blastococcus mobilis]
MRPASIPDGEVWDGARRIVIGAPNGDLTDPTIASVEVLVDQAAIGPRISARCVLEHGDLDALAAGGTVWVSFYGQQLAPFSVDVLPPAGAPVPNVRMEVDMSGDAPGFRAFLGGVPEGMDAADFAEGCAQALLAMADEWRAGQ